MRQVAQGIRSRQRLVIGMVVMLVLLGVFLAAADWSQVRVAVEAADWRPLLVALLFTAVSYFCISYSFATVCRLLGIRMGRRDLTEIGFVSTVINHIVQGGGVAGYSVRYAFMKGSGVTLQDVLAASIFHFYITSLAMLAMLPVGLTYLLLNASLAPGLTLAISLVTVALFLLFAAATVLVFHSALRGRLLLSANKLVKRVTRRDVGPRLEAFDNTMIQGVAAMRERPATLALISALIVVDWLTSAAALGYCFDALGPQVSIGELLAGFVIGIMAGVLSMLPGGLGVQEGSFAGIFGLLGVSLEQAVLASILFRGVYYLFPYAISLAFHWRLMRASTGGKGQRSKEVRHAHLDVESRISSYD